jgi:hypothetical protein
VAWPANTAMSFSSWHSMQMADADFVNMKRSFEA